MSDIDEASSDFDRRSDVDAAVKFCLEIILLDRRFDALAKVVTEGHEVAGIGFDPGCSLERRDKEVSHLAEYAAWPNGADFRAFVHPSGYDLAHPEYFMDKGSFRNYVENALNGYTKRDPEDVQRISDILQKMKSW